MENTITEEQIENIKRKIIEAVKPAIESLVQLYKKIKECFIKLWSELKTFIELNKMNKIIKIYKRTKNRRIQKNKLQK